MLESRTHHFEYAQSGKEGRLPMDVATLRILRWVCAVICSESKDKVTYTLWFEYIGKVSAFHLKLFSQSKYCSACISVTVGSFLWLTFAPFLQSSRDNILYHLEREKLIIEGYKLIFWKSLDSNFDTFFSFLCPFISSNSIIMAFLARILYLGVSISRGIENSLLSNFKLKKLTRVNFFLVLYLSSGICRWVEVTQKSHRTRKFQR